MTPIKLSTTMDNPTPREFGQLEERVRSLDSKFSDLDSKIDALAGKLDELTVMAERGRGAYWAAIALASGAGAAGGWLIKLLGKG